MDDYRRKIVLKRMSDSEFQIGDASDYHNRPHMCETCGKRFTLLENLTRHQMIHTDERPFVCTYCKKRFRLAQHLKEHVRIHTGEKPYRCDTCGRAFCQISNLKSHQKTHTKIKAFKCDICEKCFRRSFTLKQHKLTHTRRSHTGVTSGHVPDEMRSRDHAMLAKQHSAPPTLGSGGQARGIESVSPKVPQQISVIATGSSETRRAFCTISPSSKPPHPYGDPNQHGIFPNSVPTTFGEAIAGVTIKNEPTSLPPPHPSAAFPYFPSLSALLSEKEASQRGGTSLALQRSPEKCAIAPHTPDSSPSLHPKTSPIQPAYAQASGVFVSPPRRSPHFSDCSGGKGASPGRMNCGVGSHACACFVCDRSFADGNELQHHMVTFHNRKDQRRDSAYSSHSDKSLSASPSGKAVTSSSISANPLPAPSSDVTCATKRSAEEASFMRRVKELAMQALEKSQPHYAIVNDVMSHDVTKRARYETDDPTVSNEDSDGKDESDCGVLQPDLGHSPTELSASESGVKDDVQNAHEQAEVERKVVSRSSSGPHKWKRQLCNEWYDHPTQPPAEATSSDEVPRYSTMETCHEPETAESESPVPASSPLQRSNSIQAPFVSIASAATSNDRKYSDVQTSDGAPDDNATSAAASLEGGEKDIRESPSFDFTRFAPVVEWKPVVTGWRDVVYGTFYTVPPQLQQNYANFAAMAGSPGLIYPQGGVGSAQPPDQSLSAMSGGGAYDTAGHFFRFSPVSIEKFMQEFKTPTPDSSTGSDAGSGVYNRFYPSEPLPIPGYSRIQHGLLYNWDPNRVRLGGTSSISQSANLVEAS